MKKLLVLVLFLEFGLSSLTSAAPGQLQTIQLADGTKLTFLGVTRGKHEFAPGYEGMISANRIYTPDATPVAWIKAEHDPKIWPEFELLVSDRANTGCVNIEKKSSSRVRNGENILGFVLYAYPRWDKETILRVRRYHGAVADGEFVFQNPEPRQSPQWTGVPLPATRSDGDLEVTLTSFMAGAPLPRKPAEPEPNDDAVNRCARLDFTVEQNGQPTTDWQGRLVRTSDAYGNVVERVMSGYPLNGIFDYPRPGHPGSFETDGYYYTPGLWTAVPAWKVRMEFTRTANFSDDEIVTLTNLPVRSGTQQDFENQWTWDESKNKFPFTAAVVHGVQLKVLPPLLLPADGSPNETRLSVIIYSDADPAQPRMHLSLLEATDENGETIHTPFLPVSSSHFSMEFPKSKEIRTLNLKLAFQKRRYVEFTVKPSSQ